MSHGVITNFLNVNRSLTNMDGELRQFRLPTTNPFPKLDKRIASPPASSLPVRRVPSSTGVRPSLIIGRGVTQLPEMVADVIDASAGYAVENTRRERSGVRFGFGQLMERILGGRRGA